MSQRAKVYIYLTALAGLAAVTQASAEFRCEDALRFIAYLTLAIVGSGLKIVLPGIDSTVSTNFLFILAAAADLSLGETMAISAGSILAQTFWLRKGRFVGIQLVFNLAVIALSALAAFRVFHSSWITSAGGEFPLQLGLATCAYFLVNTSAVSIVISLVEAKPLIRLWKDTYLWSVPYYLGGAVCVGLMHFVNTRAGWQTSLFILPGVYMSCRLYMTYQEKLAAETKYSEEQKQHAGEMAALHLRAIEAFALAIQAKDSTTHGHLHRVQVYAVELAKDLALSESEAEALRAAALLHDIGKLAVPEHIISKPGRLTPEEFEKVKIHPLVGAEILERIKFPYPVVPIVRAHHERWDGTGYPFGLKGDEIPIGARILAAVDCLDALSSDRQYRRALPLDDAMAFIDAESGKSFDPRVVAALRRRYRELDRLSHSTLNSESSVLPRDLPTRNHAAPGAGYESLAQSVADSISADEFLASISAAGQEAQVLYQVAQDLGNSLSLEETLEGVAIRTRELVPYDTFAVWILERRESNGRTEQRLVPSHVIGTDSRTLSALEIPVGSGVSGWVAETRQPLVNGDAQLESAYLADLGVVQSFVPQFGLHSALSVPLEGSEGTIGALTLYRTERDSFSREHLRILLAICSKLGVSLENTFKFREASNSATTDYLTGLPNARSLFVYLEDRLAQSAGSGQPVTVFVTDLNGFKDVNDRFGHLEGNRLLRLLAKGLRRHCRDQDYVARMGGDEFVIVLPGVTMEQAEEIAVRLRAAAVEAGRDLTGSDAVSLSLGMAESMVDGMKAEDLLAVADKRMYAAKRAFKSSRIRELKPTAVA